MNAFFKKGQIVLFQGDSVTDCSRSRENQNDLSNGYAGKIAAVYNALFNENEIKFINRGISGNRVQNLLERYNDDFKAVKPDFISILIGINDTWRRYDSNDETTALQYENTYESLLQKIKEDMPNTKIMLIEPFLIPVKKEQEVWREDLDPKIQVVRRLANKYADYCLPADGIFASLQTKNVSPDIYAADGVHPTSLGHNIIAQTYLKALNII